MTSFSLLTDEIQSKSDLSTALHCPPRSLNGVQVVHEAKGYDIEFLKADNYTAAGIGDAVVNLSLIFSQLFSAGRDSTVLFH